MVDAEGHRIQLKRDKERNLEELISPSGHTIRFKYDGDRILEAVDDEGHLRKYFYDQFERLIRVSDGARVLYRFEYQSAASGVNRDPWLLSTVIDGDWNVLLRIRYENERVSEQILADGEKYGYKYELKGKEVLQTTVTLPSGKRRQFFFQDGVLTRQE